jgi:cytochrome c553
MKTLVFLMLILSLTACGERGSLQFKDRRLLTLEANPDFNSIRQEVLLPHCISCHQDYDRYQGSLAQLELILAEVESDRMPKGKPALNQHLKRMLREWVAAGAPEGSPVTGNGSGGTNWSTVAATILAPKCIRCHNPEGEVPFIDLTSRQALWQQRKRLLNFEDPAASYLLEVIQDPDEPMPPKNSNINPLTESEIATLREWITLGIP